MTTPHPEPQVDVSRAALFRSEVFRAHDTGSHPENAGRLVAVDEALERLDLLEGRPDVPFGTASDEALTRVHDPRYIAGLREFAAQRGGWLDADTVVSPALFEVAALAAGAGIAAVNASLEDRSRRGFVLARPPGHHATAMR